MGVSAEPQDSKTVRQSATDVESLRANRAGCPQENNILHDHRLSLECSVKEPLTDEAPTRFECFVHSPILSASPESPQHQRIRLPLLQGDK